MAEIRHQIVEATVVLSGDEKTFLEEAGLSVAVMVEAGIEGGQAACARATQTDCSLEGKVDDRGDATFWCARRICNSAVSCQLRAPAAMLNALFKATG